MKLNNVDKLVEKLGSENYKSRNLSQVYLEASVELQEDELDEVFDEWKNHVNMTASELEKWSKNPCSREASVDPAAVIKRNLRLLETNKDEWTDEDIKDAKRTISFISRMKANNPDAPKDGAHGCPSDWAISMLNWAFNPFDSVPTPNEEVEDELEPVDEITMQERKNIKEAEMLAEPVWKLKDELSEFAEKMEEKAMQLEETKSKDEVENIRDELTEAIDLMMENIDEPISRIKGSEEEMQEFKFGEEDEVAWDSSGGKAFGVVRDRTNEGCYDASIDGDVEVCGTEEEPAYLIQIWNDEQKQLEDTMVAHKEDTLEATNLDVDQEDLRIGPDSDNRVANYEFEPVPDQVVYFDQELAQQRATNIGLEGTHEHVLVLDGEEVTVYMAGSEHQDWAEIVNHPRQLEDEEMSKEVKEAEKVFSTHETIKKDDDSGENTVRVNPTTIHELTSSEEE